MPWNLIHRASLRVRLLALLLPVMALVVAASLWFTRSDALASANAAYDRSLLGAIKALDTNVSTASGGLSIELPYRLFEFFQLTATGNVYFRVATADGLVEIGSPDLPKPPLPLQIGQPLFYDAEYFEESVRVGAFMRDLVQPVGSSVSDKLVIQVAESTTSRQQFTASFFRRAALRDALLLLIMGVAVIFGLTIALRPISALAQQTQTRQADDLSPLETNDIPKDIRPLVDAINQQLERTVHLTTQRRRFIDDASHQLRTPLTVLRAQLDFLLREQDPQQQKIALLALSNELNQAIRATNQLLALALQDASQPAIGMFDLGQLARDVALEFLPLSREYGIDLGVEAANTPVIAQGDAALLRPALANLVHNAMTHGKQQGIVTIKAWASDSVYVLLVCDNGAGIDSELLPRLGERFAKGRGSRGSGLGLAIVRTAIERHGGTLNIGPVLHPPGTCASLQWPKK
jgi:two-component system, OmpR family, sensor histidine kinase TctE